jgi:hypothetical protein
MYVQEARFSPAKSEPIRARWGEPVLAVGGKFTVESPEYGYRTRNQAAVTEMQ